MIYFFLLIIILFSVNNWKDIKIFYITDREKTQSEKVQRKHFINFQLENIFDKVVYNLGMVKDNLSKTK